MGTVDVGDHGHRSHVRSRCRVERGASVAALPAARGIGPVQGRIDGEQVRQEIALAIDQFVAPLDAHLSVPIGLDGERRVIEGAAFGDSAWKIDGTVAPHRGFGMWR